MMVGERRKITVGLSQTDLMDRLIAHAFARHARRRALSSE
jgi:hypothetical protein